MALTAEQAKELIEASTFAVAMNMPFNRFTTVHWEAAGVAEPLTATKRLFKLLGDAMRTCDAPFAYVWVREAGLSQGEHVHILWHGPAELPVWRRRLQGWIRLCGGTPKRGVCRTRTVGRHLAHAPKADHDYRANLNEVLDYMLKGADASARRTLGVRRSKPGGETIGKRCGSSANIGPAARKRALGYLQRASKGCPLDSRLANP